MEETVSPQRIPNTDSIEELARFWDSHDLTDFENQMEEVSEPVFLRVSRRTSPLGARSRPWKIPGRSTGGAARSEQLEFGRCGVSQAHPNPPGAM